MLYLIFVLISVLYFNYKWPVVTYFFNLFPVNNNYLSLTRDKLKKATKELGVSMAKWLNVYQNKVKKGARLENWRSQVKVHPDHSLELFHGRPEFCSFASCQMGFFNLVMPNLHYLFLKSNCFAPLFFGYRH